MSIKKTMLLASTALAMIAFAVPASASALKVVDAGVTVSEATVVFSGQAKFNTLGTGIECPIHATVTISAGAPSATAFVATTPCTFNGLLAPCEFEVHPEATNLPQVLTITTATTLTATGGILDSSLKTKTAAHSGNCPTTKNNLIVSPEHDLTITLVKNASGDITGANLSGIVQDEQDSSTLLVGVTSPGGLTIDAAHSGTYTIE